MMMGRLVLPNPPDLAGVAVVSENGTIWTVIDSVDRWWYDVLYVLVTFFGVENESWR